jgi:DNA transformation protein
MGSNLSKRINIGRDTESKLIQVGINSIEELESIGAEQAFIRLRTMDPGACLSLLYGLQGAIDNIKWNELPDEKKQELIEFYKMTKKQI